MSRVHAATFVGLGCLLAACPSTRGNSGVVAPTVSPAASDDRPLRISIARAEAEREDGVRGLEEIVRTGGRPGKLLALRGLGRIGGANARRVLLTALGDPDPELIAAAMAAIGVARELDDLSIEDNAPNVEPLHAAFARTSGAGRVLAIEALGRAGDQRSQPLLVAELAGPPELAEAAGIALARHGRRKIALTPATLPVVLDVITHGASVRTRYAAIYALARAHVPTPPSAPTLPAVLLERVGDADRAVRVQAILAIVKFKLVSSAGSQLTPALLDRDWSVAVEAVRALTGDQADAVSADAVATALVRRLPALDDGVETEAHVILEGLRGLQKSGARPVVATTLRTLTQWASTTTKAPALTRAWIECLATSAYARGANQLAPVAACGGGALPDHLRLPLVADLIAAKIGSLAERRSQLGALLAHKDVRIRAAALGALTAAWKESTEADHRSTIGILVSALASPEPLFAGTAVEAAEGFYEAIGTGDHSAIDAAVIERATIEKDPDLSGPLLELIGKRKLAAGLEACRAGLAGGPGRAKAARGCMSALGEAVGETTPTHAAAPPVDVSTVIGASLEWHLATTRGELVIDLRPDVAPWAVASILSLTTKGLYDGLEFHRVVPGFVVQGGDPTESGSGGPGYVLPAEPATTADGPGYLAGGVGLADSGRDSAGSQWFVMHARAAHLDGRYTWVGSLRSGQNSADALLIGDKVVKATITIKSAAHN